MEYSRKRTTWQAVLIVASLFIPSGLLVASTSGWSDDSTSFLRHTLLINAILCLFVGGACMFMGYVFAFARHEWTEPQPLIGLGAKIGVFTLLVFLPYMG